MLETIYSASIVYEVKRAGLREGRVVAEERGEYLPVSQIEFDVVNHWQSYWLGWCYVLAETPRHYAIGTKWVILRLQSMNYRFS